MTTATYVANRSIQPGHSVGASYTIDLRPRTLSPTQKTVSKESKSISGVTQTVVERREILWQVETRQLREDSQEYLDLLEFCESVDEMEHFTFDERGSLSMPSSPLPAKLEKNYVRKRVEQQPEWVFSFTLRILPS